MKRITIILASCLLAACAGTEYSSDSGSTAAVNTDFYQHWVHSYEEQNGQKIPNIFRPAGSRAFPPSRFRMEFGFDANGQCKYKFLSPVDAHQMRDCIYTKIGNKVYLYDAAGKALNHLAFTIEYVNKAEMRMAYGVAKTVPKKNAKPQ